MPTETNRRPLVSAGAVLGIGMGGFADGIVLHQLLQIHNMMSAVRPKDSIVNMEVNMFWDGLFHAACWSFAVVGLFMLFRAGRRPKVPWSGKTLVGSMILGWGVFNLVEGVVDHHILGIHHVVERLGLSVWDWAFLGSGVAFIAIGLMMIAGARKEHQPPGYSAAARA